MVRPCAAQSLMGAGMDERVRYDEVALLRKRGEQGHVGGEAVREEQRRLRSEEAGRLFFERLMFGCVARSEEHTSELQSLMRISYAVFCLKKKKQKQIYNKLKTPIKKTKTYYQNIHTNK